jgi:DNA-binding LacI/PurR family transcriptional regulator
VVGFDDNPLAVRLRPALTTVRQDVAEKGRLAAAELIRILAAAGDPATDETAGPQHVLLPTELVIRDSTTRPRTSTHSLESDR